MTNDKRPTEAELRARALARWEGEGGALIPTDSADSIDESELRILARLGAALLSEWQRVPQTVQSSVIYRARTLGAPGDHARVKDMLATFLEEHRSEC